jgi:hypothetical protein
MKIDELLQGYISIRCAGEKLIVFVDWDFFAFMCIHYDQIFTVQKKSDEKESETS